MKAGQTGGAVEPDPIPPVTPPDPNHDWLPKNLTYDIVEDLFGTLLRHNLDGTTDELPFDKNGVISNAWLARGAKDVVYPEAREWWVVFDQTAGVNRHVVSFMNGWLLFGSDGSRESWHWQGA
jgi:hypothetical protein